MLNRRLTRADENVHKFLGQRLAGEVIERTAPVLRSFAHTLITGPLAAGARPALEVAERFGALHVKAGPGDLFNCVISLLELQSADDPVGVLIQHRRRLKPDGLLIACPEFVKAIRRNSSFVGYKLFQCPMTSKSFPGAPKNGVWLQKGGTIRNPYFGADMIDCGTEIKP